MNNYFLKFCYARIKRIKLYHDVVLPLELECRMFSIAFVLRIIRERKKNERCMFSFLPLHSDKITNLYTQSIRHL
jgi:hypothetical protein